MCLLDFVAASAGCNNRCSLFIKYAYKPFFCLVQGGLSTSCTNRIGASSVFSNLAVTLSGSLNNKVYWHSFVTEYLSEKSKSEYIVFIMLLINPYLPGPPTAVWVSYSYSEHLNVNAALLALLFHFFLNIESHLHDCD